MKKNILFLSKTLAIFSWYRYC